MYTLTPLCAKCIRMWNPPKKMGNSSNFKQHMYRKFWQRRQKWESASKRATPIGFYAFLFLLQCCHVFIAACFFLSSSSSSSVIHFAVSLLAIMAAQNLSPYFFSRFDIYVFWAIYEPKIRYQPLQIVQYWQNGFFIVFYISLRFNLLLCSDVLFSGTSLQQKWACYCFNSGWWTVLSSSFHYDSNLIIVCASPLFSLSHLSCVHASMEFLTATQAHCVCIWFIFALWLKVSTVIFYLVFVCACVYTFTCLLARMLVMCVCTCI